MTGIPSPWTWVYLSQSCLDWSLNWYYMVFEAFDDHVYFNYKIMVQLGEIDKNMLTYLMTGSKEAVFLSKYELTPRVHLSST